MTCIMAPFVAPMCFLPFGVPDYAHPERTLSIYHVSMFVVMQ